MKKNLLSSFLISVFTLVSGAVFAQAPTVSYSPNSYAYGLSAPVSITPTSANVTGGYAALSTFATRSKSSGLAYDASLGKFFTVNYVAAGRLYSTTIASATFATVGASQSLYGALSVVSDGHGNIFVSTQNGGGGALVVKINGTSGTVIGSFSTATAPGGMAADPSGNVYVADAGTSKIYKIGFNASALGTMTAVPITFSSAPLAVAASATTLYISLTNGTLASAPIAGGSLSTITTGITAQNLSLDASGNIYDVDTNTGNISIITTGGTVTTPFSTGISSATQVAFDPATGNLYEADYGNNAVEVATFQKYTIDAALPSGLTFSNSAGTVTGTTSSTTTSGPTTYNVTAYNLSGPSASTPLTITVTKPPVLSYSPASYTFTAGISASTTIPIVNNGGAVTSPYTFTLTGGGPSLPPGLTYSTAQGPPGAVFTYNTATAAPGTVTYSVNGTNAAGQSSASPATITITIVNPAPPTSITYPYTSTSPNAFTFTQGAVVSETPTVTPSGVVPASGAYTITPTTLPTGLIFNNNTGVISGTLSASATPGTTSYSVKVTNAGGSATANFNIIVVAPAPAISYYTPATYGIGQGVNLTPTSTGGAVVSYSVSPALPGGLGINMGTGAITGTTTTAAAAANYTVSATNSGGTTTFPINITVVAQPAISYTPTVSNLPINVAVTLSPTNAGGPIAPTSFGTPVTLPAPGTNPWGMTIDASFNVYVVNFGGTTVTKYLAPGYTTTTTINIATDTSPTGIAVDNTGEIYIAYQAGHVYKYPSGGGTGTLVTNTIYAFSSSTLLNYGIAIDASKNLYITDNHDGIVWKCTNGTGVTATQIIPAGTTGITKPTGIAVDAAGNIYIVDQTTKALNKYSSSGVYQTTIASGFNTPYGLTIDANGNFYIADSGTGSVYVYNSSGASLTSITGLTAPRGLVTDPTGNLYVSDYTNKTVTQYPPNFYVINPTALPMGLTFNSITGTISGTPTVSPFGPTVYNITAHGYAGIGVSSTETISCYTSYDWIGATADWQTNTNWESKTVPTSSSAVYVGVNYPFTTAPVVSSTGSANAASVTFGNKGGVSGAAKLAGITVNTGYSLTVAGAITKQSDVNSGSAGTYVSTLSGTGAITAASLNVLQNATATAAYTDGLSSSVTTLTISGNAAVTSTTSPFASTLSLNITGGSASIGGNVSLTSTASPSVSNLSFNVTGGTTTLAGTLSSANASGSTSTFKVINGTLNLANTAAFALSGSGTNVVSFNNAGSTIGYTGTTAQTFYTDFGITGLATGLSYQNISFSGAGVKTPPSGSSATNNLNVAGDFTNTMANTTANNVTLTGTIVNFTGATAQNLYGGAGPTIAAGALTTTAPSPFGTLFNNVNFSGGGTKTMQTGGFSVATTGILTMSGSTALAAGGLLTLNSNAASSATVAQIPSGSSITGNVNVQRYLTGGSGYRGYRLMSSPVSGSTDAYGHKIYSLNYLIRAMYLKGTTATPGGFDVAGNDNIYLYRENEAPSSQTFFSGNYNGISSLGTTFPNYIYTIDGITPTNPYSIPVGDGFLVFFRGDRNATTITNESVTTYVPVAAITTATGTLNQGTINTADWYTPSVNTLGFTSATLNSSVRGFNLLGNPYASTIDLNTASTTAGSGIQITPNVETNFYELNINGTYAQQYAIYDQANPTLNTNNATRYLASGQGVIVKVDAAGESVIFNETAKVSAANAASTQPTGPTLFLASRPEMSTITDASTFNSKNGDASKYLRLTIKMDSTSAEDAVVAFNETASANYVQNVDALYKQGTGKVSMSSISADNQQLAINTLPINKKSTTTIPLYVSAVADGTYSLNLTEIKNIPAIYEVWLMDAYAKDSLQIRQNPTYSFNIAHADTNTFGSKRFTLVIRENALLAYHLLKFDATKAINGSKVTWNIENEQNYTGFTVQRTNDNGKNFDNLGVVSSNSGGNYSYLDTNPLLGTDGYRLQITDLLGNISYSKIVPLLYSKLGDNITKNTLTIYPNPTIGAINVAVSQQINSTSFDIQIVNSGGMMMKKATSPTANWQSDVSKLLPGTYVIQIVNNKDKSIVGKGTFVKL